MFVPILFQKIASEKRVKQKIVGLFILFILN